MTEKEYTDFEQNLLSKDYRKRSHSCFSSESVYFYKPLVYEEDSYGDRRAVCQIFYLVWDWKEFRDRLPKDYDFGLECRVNISRNTDERIDVLLYSDKYNFFDVKFAESKALELYEFFNKEFPL